MVCEKSKACIVYVFLLKYLYGLYDIVQVWIHIIFLQAYFPYEKKMILTQMLICCLGRIIIYLIELAQIYCLKVYDDRDTVVIRPYWELYHWWAVFSRCFFSGNTPELLSALTCLEFTLMESMVKIDAYSGITSCWDSLEN